MPPPALEPAFERGDPPDDAAQRPIDGGGVHQADHGDEDDQAQRDARSLDEVLEPEVDGHGVEEQRHCQAASGQEYRRTEKAAEKTHHDRVENRHAFLVEHVYLPRPATGLRRRHTTEEDVGEPGPYAPEPGDSRLELRGEHPDPGPRRQPVEDHHRGHQHEVFPLERPQMIEARRERRPVEHENHPQRRQNDENPEAFPDFLTRRQRAAGAFPPVGGRRLHGSLARHKALRSITEASTPPPATLWTSTSPPISCDSDRQIASPRPVPVVLVEK